MSKISAGKRNRTSRRRRRSQPLPTLGQQLGEWPRIFHPELRAHGILLEEAASQVEVEHVVEHVHALMVGQLLEEVVVWYSLDGLQDLLELPPSGGLR